MRHVIWFSCGACSTIVAKLVKSKYPDAILVYCDTGGEHEDNKRFLANVESWLNTEIVILRSDKYKSHLDVWEKTKYINGVNGARCTAALKRELRFKFQEPDDIHYFGYSLEERHRADRLVESFPEITAKFPLIEESITKDMCLGILDKHGIEIPIMYRLGYNNNNCIGCCKGGKGYWNKIRKDFPETFEKVARIERDCGHSCINGTFLDELKPNAGRHNEQIINCDFVCQALEI